MSANNLHELVGQWRANPTPDRAVGACRLLTAQVNGGGHAQPLLASELANQIDRVHGEDVEVLLSLGQMLIAHGDFERAKVVLLKATKRGSRAAAPRYLGEILLREGDAVRAVRALRGSLQMGGDEPETRAWYDSALAYVPMQNASGVEAVARAVLAGLRNMGRFNELPEPLRDEPTVSSQELPAFVSSELVEEVSHIDEDVDIVDEVSITSLNEPATRIVHQVPQHLSAKPSGRPSQPRLRGIEEGTAIMSIDELRAAQRHDRPSIDEVPISNPVWGPDEDAVHEARTLEARPKDAQIRNAIARAKAAKVRDDDDELPPPPIADPETEDEFIKRLRSEGLSLDDDGAFTKDKGSVSTSSGRGRDREERAAQARWDAKTKGLELPRPQQDSAPPSSRAPVSSSAPVNKPGAAKQPRKRSRKPRYGTWALGAAAVLALLLLAIRTGQLPIFAEVLPEWLAGPNAGPDDAVTETTPDSSPPVGPAPEPPAPAAATTEAAPVTTAPVAAPSEPAAEPSAAPVADATPHSSPPVGPAPKPAPVSYPRYTAVQPRPQPKAEPPPPPPSKPPPPPSGNEPTEPVWLGDPELNQ